MKNMSRNNVELPDLFRMAKISSKHSKCKTRMGCVIVKNGKPIGWGFNRVKSHPYFNNGVKQTIHAEASAILSSGRESCKNSVAIIYRENGETHLPALAKPCKHCMKLLKEFGVKKIYYTTNEYPFFAVERI